MILFLSLIHGTNIKGRKNIGKLIYVNGEIF